MLSVIGKGSYGKVLLVKKNDTGELYALKVLKKQEILRRNQVEHTMTERRILVWNRHQQLTLNIGFSETSIHCADVLCLLIRHKVVLRPRVLPRRRALLLFVSNWQIQGRCCQILRIQHSTGIGAPTFIEHTIQRVSIKLS